MVDVRNSLIMNRYIDSRENRDEIFINDRPYGITEKLKRRLKFKNILIYVEIIILAMFFKKLKENGLGFNNNFFNIFIFFIISLIFVYITSKIIISDKLVKEEVIPLNRMYR